MTKIAVIRVDTKGLEEIAGRKLTKKEIDNIIFLYHEELANNFNTDDMVVDIMREELGL